MTSTTTAASAAYATEMAHLLWPAAAPAPYVTHRRHRAGQPHRDAYLFPSERHPRLLVPADLPGSASMIRRLGNGHSPLVLPLLRLLEHSVHTRAFTFARWPMLRVPLTDPTADSIERHLAGCIGTEVRVGVLLGTRRVNQKPVLQVYDLQGRLRAYAKVGHTDLTAGLVRREAASLSMVAARRPQSFRVPQVLYHDQWAGLEVLVMSPLPTSTRQEVARAVRFTAMREVTGLCGTTVLPLVESGFWHRLRHDVDLLSSQSHGLRLAESVASIEARHGSDLVQLGGWHGDWGAWNMGMGSGNLQVWDWERFDPEVPVGFDGLHFDAQKVRPGEAGERGQEEAFLRSVPRTLSGMDIPTDRHDLTLRLYLLEVGVRYVDALRYGATPPLRRRTSWVLSLLERLSEHHRPALSKGHS